MNRFCTAWPEKQKKIKMAATAAILDVIMSSFEKKTSYLHKISTRSVEFLLR